MAKVLVTGGAGYIGSVCSAELLRCGHAVTVLDNLSTGFRDAVPAGADLWECDIADEDAVQSLVKRNHFDAVFHFAAKSLVAESYQEPGPYFRTNVAGTVIFLETLRRAGIRKVVFSSSAAVYGTPERIPIEEDDAAAPVNPYGESKLAVEKMLRWYASAEGWSVVAFRYFNAAGATQEHGERHEPETRVIPRLLQAAAGQGGPFPICGEDYPTRDGTCIRDYVHVLDIARAHTAVLPGMQRPGFRVYNIGSGDGYSVRELISAVERITGRQVPTYQAERRPGDPAALCASPKRLMRELDWRPERDLEQILRSAWHFKFVQQRVEVESLCREERASGVLAKES